MLCDFVQEGKRSRNQSLLKCGLMKKFANSQARRQIQALASAKNAKHGAYPHSAQKNGNRETISPFSSYPEAQLQLFLFKGLGHNSRILLLVPLVLHAYVQRSCLVRRADSGGCSFSTSESAACTAGLIHSSCGY